jgi:hypothetical protein
MVFNLTHLSMLQLHFDATRLFQKEVEGKLTEDIFSSFIFTSTQDAGRR